MFSRGGSLLLLVTLTRALLMTSSYPKVIPRELSLSEIPKMVALRAKPSLATLNEAPAISTSETVTTIGVATDALSTPTPAPSSPPAPATAAAAPSTPAVPTTLPPLKRSSTPATSAPTQSKNLAISTPNNILHPTTLPKPTIASAAPPVNLNGPMDSAPPAGLQQPPKKRRSVELSTEEAAVVRKTARKHSLGVCGIEMRGVSIAFLEEFRADIAQRHEWLQMQARCK